MVEIPAPPRWLWGAIMVLSFVVLGLSIVHGAPARFDLPGGYAGRPPTSKQWPGRCWCKFHGPRGGCMQWNCAHRGR